MPDEKRRNPFEEFIDSESFDVSKLDTTISPVRDEIQLAVQDLLADLQPISYELYDELDDRQKRICAYLITELDAILRDDTTDLDIDLSNEELVQAVTIPVMLAMIAEARLHKPPPPEEPLIIPRSFDYQVDANPNLPASWSEIFKEFIKRTQSFFKRVFSSIQRR